MQQRQRCLPDGSSVKREFQALFCEKPEVQSLRLTLPICARLHHSGDLCQSCQFATHSFSRPFNWAFRMRFSAARYSFRASNSWSDRPRDVGQDARQIHESPPPVQSAMGAIDRRKGVAHDRRRGHAERGYCPRFLPFQFFDHTG